MKKKIPLALVMFVIMVRLISVNETPTTIVLPANLKASTNFCASFVFGTRLSIRELALLLTECY